MKNLKNTIAALSLMAVMGLGAVSANAGLLISDRSNTNQQELCAPVKDTMTNDFDGIIIVGLSFVDGIIIVGREGLMLSDRSKDCGSNAKDGILITD